MVSTNPLSNRQSSQPVLPSGAIGMSWIASTFLSSPGILPGSSGNGINSASARLLHRHLTSTP
jgi:hypothetical protein